MLIRKAFKFEITPNGQQTHKMKQFSGCSRFVFNKALAYQNEQYKDFIMKDKTLIGKKIKIFDIIPNQSINVSQMNWIYSHKFSY